MVNYRNRVQNTTVRKVLVQVYLLSVLAAPPDEALPPPANAAQDGWKKSIGQNCRTSSRRAAHLPGPLQEAAGRTLPGSTRPPPPRPWGEAPAMSCCRERSLGKGSGEEYRAHRGNRRARCRPRPHALQIEMERSDF